MARDVEVDDVDNEVEEGVVDSGGDDVVVGVLEDYTYVISMSAK